MMRQALVICLNVFFISHASGQDSQLYRVQVSTNVMIDALSRTQVQTHSMIPGDVLFFDSDWYVHVNDRAGASVAFTAGPFVNSSDSNYQRDTQLRLRNLQNQRPGNWRFDVQSDRTRIATGKDTAVVTMSTNRRGSANLSLQVRFYTAASPETNLAAGNYITTVIGTITPN